ncbi:MAG TPA: hypothetical protein VGD77_00430 [Gemmatimonadaceae bacterium]
MTLQRRATLLTGAVVFAVLYLVARPLAVGAVQDDGIYMVLARALATGEGYRYIHLPGMPHATHYPPGYPALLAILWRLWPSFPENVALFQLANVLCAAVAAGVLVSLATRAGLSVRAGVAVALAGSLMLPALVVVSPLMSEPLWLAITLPLLLAADRWLAEGTPGELATAALLGAWTAASALVRTQSVVILAVLVLLLASRRRWRDAVAAGAAGTILLLPWYVWVRAHRSELPPMLEGKYGSYAAWLVDGWAAAGPALFAVSARRNLGDIVSLLGWVTAPPGAPGVVIALLSAAVVALLLWGSLALWRRMPVLVAFTWLYLAIVVVWPFPPHRFLWSVWPLLVLLVAAGARAAAAVLAPQGRRPLRLAAAGLALLVVAGAAIHTAQAYRRRTFETYQATGLYRLQSAVRWVAEHTPPGALVASDDETAVFLYTGRRAVPTDAFLAVTRMTEGDAAVPSALPRIVATYQPAFVVAGWRRTIRAADALAAARPPTLVRVSTLSPGVAYARIP